MSAHPQSDLSSPFRMQVQVSKEEIIVRCNGRLTTETTAAFKAEIKALIPETRHIVIDLSAVNYMDSSGLGALVGLYVSARGAKCDFELVNVGKRIYELLRITNVISIFESCGKYMIRMP